MDFDSKDFKELQAKWYSKLKKDGFSDVEGPEINRKSSHFGKRAIGISGRQPSFREIEETRQFFSEVASVIRDDPPKNIAYRRALELYLEGMSRRQVLSKIRSEGLKMGNTTYDKLILKYEGLVLNKLKV